MRIIPVIFAVIIFLSGCGNRGNNSDIARGTDSDVSYGPEDVEKKDRTDIVGIYSGVLPCADCSGIEVDLKLTADGKHDLTTRHISDREGEKDIESHYDGNYTWNDHTRTVTLTGLTNQPNKYLVSGRDLIQLDMAGKKIDGPLAEKYILKRNNLSMRSLTAGI